MSKTRPGALGKRRAGVRLRVPMEPVVSGDVDSPCGVAGWVGIHATPVVPFVQIKPRSSCNIEPSKLDGGLGGAARTAADRRDRSMIV